jgi:hypothetical protein
MEQTKALNALEVRIALQYFTPNNHFLLKLELLMMLIKRSSLSLFSLSQSRPPLHVPPQILSNAQHRRRIPFSSPNSSKPHKSRTSRQPTNSHRTSSYSRSSATERTKHMSARPVFRLWTMPSSGSCASSPCSRSRGKRAAGTNRPPLPP